MENLTTANSVQVKDLFVFNSNFGNDVDDEMGKILYFYPETTSEDKQLNKVGLCEAIIKFAETFNTEVPCESLHTMKCRYVFFQPEPEYWFAVVLCIPSVPKLSPEGIECVEYLNDEVQDNVFRAVLARLYDKFTLLNDKLHRIVRNNGVSELKTRLQKCLSTWVRRIDANNSGVIDIFRGLQFLPLNREMFLRVQCFVNNLMVTWPQIKYVVLMQGEKLIWSGIDQIHVQLFYDYLLNELLSQHFLSGLDKQSTYGIIFKKESHVALEVNDDARSKIRNSSLSLFNAGQGINNSKANSLSGGNHSDDRDTDSFMTASSTTVEGRDEVKTQRYHMLIYKAEQSYLTLLIPESVDFEKTFVTKVESFLNLNFTPMSRELARNQNLKANANSSPSGFSSILSSNNSDSAANVKYLYFNNLNFAEKMSPGYQCDLESYKLLADLKSDLSRMNENGEITAKMVSENWIVAKVSNRREFYAIFNQKNSNLLEIDEEMRKLTEAHLTNIFFQD